MAIEDGVAARPETGVGLWSMEYWTRTLRWHVCPQPEIGGTGVMLARVPLLMTELGAMTDFGDD